MSYITKQQFEAAYGHEVSDTEFVAVSNIFDAVNMPLNEFAEAYGNLPADDSPIIRALVGNVRLARVELGRMEDELFRTRGRVADAIAAAQPYEHGALRALAVELVGEQSYLLAKLKSSSPLDEDDRKALIAFLQKGEVLPFGDIEI